MNQISEQQRTTMVDDTGPDTGPLGRSLTLAAVYPRSHRAFIRLDDHEVLAVGRETQGFRLDDPRMSRLHFQIVWDGRHGAPRLGDAGSANGTYLNGRQISTAILSRGDVIRAGSSLFVVHQTADSLMQEAVSLAERVAPSPLTVLLLGETGTGKEMMAGQIHAASRRAGPFVSVNCGAVPRGLATAEFFGHTRGAYSGAGASRAGLFAAAQSGTLFLDEVGELPVDLQPTLLRVLQDRRIRRLGSDREIDVDVRVVAATNRPLDELSTGTQFRADLYARLSQVIIELPALRSRRPELLSLADELAREAGGELQLDADAAEALLLWHWPHNVRELKSLIDLHLVLNGPRELCQRDLRELRPDLVSGLKGRRVQSTSPLGSPTGKRMLPSPLADRLKLQELLARHRGSVRAVAAELGTHRTQVYRWMDRLGIERRRR